MPDVAIGGKTVSVERFTLAKAMRVITLLGLIQKQVPEVTKEWAAFRKNYGEEYAIELSRSQALVRFGEQLDRLTEADWERDGQAFRIPGSPSGPELFFAMAPMVYERAEEVVLRLLGLIAMDNDTVGRYVAKGDIWERVDELVDEIIKPAALDEIMELAITACEVIDGQVLTKAKGLGDRAGNVARLFGMRTTSRSEDSGTSSVSHEQPSTDSVSRSPSDTTGPLTTFSDSPMTSSSPSGMSVSEPIATAS